MSQIHFTEINNRTLISVLFVFALATFAKNAYSACDVKGDIPFTASNNATEELCVSCAGPWLRSSAPTALHAGLQNCTFYAANKSILSPYGEWRCGVFSNEDCSEEPDHEVVFCLDSSTDIGVDVIINADESLTVNWPGPPCSSSVGAFLGDNFKQEKSKRDIDVFTFDGSNGDEVRLTLETDPKEGHNGGDASLGTGGNSLNGSTVGTLPLEINITLPADGEYSIIVEQPRIPEDQRFRGSYILRLESSSGNIDLIKPTNNVEK